jgi:3-dehydroquinate dehydratase-2
VLAPGDIQEVADRRVRHLQLSPHVGFERGVSSGLEQDETDGHWVEWPSFQNTPEREMPKILVIHGAGMNMRGKVQLDVFGPMTLPEYDERIRGYAAELGVEIEIFHSNVEGEVVNRFYTANDQGFDAAIFNPAAFGTGYPALVAAIAQVMFPTTEVHISNPIRRGPASQTAAVSQSVVAGFGIAGYALALRGIRDMLAAKE